MLKRSRKWGHQLVKQAIYTSSGNGGDVIALIALVKERFHNAVEIDILGIFEVYSSLQIWPPQKIFQGRNYSGRMI